MCIIRVCDPAAELDKWSDEQCSDLYHHLFSALRESIRGFFLPCRGEFLLQNKIPDHQYIHLRPAKTIQRFFRPAHNRFVVIKGRVQQNRDACLVTESSQKLP